MDSDINGSMNNLLNITIRYYAVLLLAILLLSAPAFYLIIERLFIQDVDEALLLRKEEFLKYRVNTLKTSDLVLWNSYNRDDNLIASEMRLMKDSIFQQFFLDTLANEWEPYRVLLTPVTIDNSKYNLQIRISLVESEDLMFSILITFSVVVVMVMAGMILITRWLSKRLWGPFYETIDLMEDLEMDKINDVLLTDSRVEEFVRLNASLKKLLEKNQRIFRSQKEFTENASHEIQTPLAIFQSKLDMLLQSEGLTEEQFKLIRDLSSSTKRLSKLNQNLLLLSKLDNDQFSKSDEIDISATVMSIAAALSPLADIKSVKINCHVVPLQLKGNRILFEILVNNLLANAVRYNEENGMIGITLSRSALVISNSGPELTLSPEKLFERFGKGDHPQSTGLGLAIAKKICDAFGYTIRYSRQNHLHEFTITF